MNYFERLAEVPENTAYQEHVNDEIVMLKTDVNGKTMSLKWKSGILVVTSTRELTDWDGKYVITDRTTSDRPNKYTQSCTHFRVEDNKNNYCYFPEKNLDESGYFFTTLMELLENAERFEGKGSYVWISENGDKMVVGFSSDNLSESNLLEIDKLRGVVSVSNTSYKFVRGSFVEDVSVVLSDDPNIRTLNTSRTDKDFDKGTVSHTKNSQKITEHMVFVEELNGFIKDVYKLDL